MSSIGSGPGIGSGPVVETSAVRAVGSSDPGATLQTSSPTSAPTPSVVAATVATSAALDAGAAPIDQDRVATIRKAIADNNYPVLPAKIGDAMIAAGMLLRMAK